jgi:predicted ATPase
MWENEPEGMRVAVTRHDELIANAVEAQGGSLLRNTGDGFVAIFPTADGALRAAIAAQLAMGAESWSLSNGLRARMAVHTDAVAMADGQYLSTPFNRCSRLMSAAHGGQIICSDATAALARSNPLGDARLIDLGEHRLRDLAQPVHVFQVVHPELDHEFPPLRTLDAYPSNLPVQLTTFIGRDRLLDEVATVLDEARVVTLTGVGGVGKSRLAVQVAADVIPRYRDGAWLVELAPVTDADAVLEVVATTLGITQRQGQSLASSVADFLRSKRLVLVIDNCEHLLDAAARFIDETLRACPHVSVIATSREGLGVAGERMMVVPSLELPPAGNDTVEGSVPSEAVRLFVERANEASAGFSVTDDNRDSISRLCRRLDGIPLAIELAAARVRSLTPTELATRLDARFRLLAGGPRTAVERHQTLRRAIDWSYDLLSETEKIVLNRLAVFAGSFTLDAAEAVIVDDTVDPVDVVDYLGHLVDKSLLVAEHSGRVTRYRLLETIRQYAEERLEDAGGAAWCRQRHAEYYASFAALARRGLRGPDEVEWTARAEAELDNLRTALGWSHASGDAVPAMRLVAALDFPGTQIGYATGPWAQTALSIPGASDDPLFPEVQAWAGWAALVSGDYERGARLAEDAVAAVDREGADDEIKCGVLCSAAGIFGWGGRLPEAGTLARSWAAYARSSGDEYGLSQALTVIGVSLSFSGDAPAALASLEEAIEVSARLGNPTAITYANMTAGMVLSETDPERALGLFDEALDRATSVRNNLGIGLVLSAIAGLHNTRGSWEDGAPMIVRALEHFHRIGDVAFFKNLLHTALLILRMAGADEAAAVVYGATPLAKDVAEGRGFWDTPWMDPMREALNDLETRLGSDRFAALLARGSRMDDDEVLLFVRQELDRRLSATAPGGRFAET